MSVVLTVCAGRAEKGSILGGKTRNAGKEAPIIDRETALNARGGRSIRVTIRNDPRIVKKNALRKRKKRPQEEKKKRA